MSAPFVYVPPPVVVHTSGAGEASALSITLMLVCPFLFLWGFIECLCWFGRITDRYDAIKARKQGRPVYNSDINRSPTSVLWFMTRRWFRRKMHV